MVISQRFRAENRRKVLRYLLCLAGAVGVSGGRSTDGVKIEMAVAERILHLRPETDTRPDRALVYEAQRGHEEAATTLIRRYYPRIYSFVSHLTYGRSNTED